jgi:hypothetical protein
MDACRHPWIRFGGSCKPVHSRMQGHCLEKHQALEECRMRPGKRSRELACSPAPFYRSGFSFLSFKGCLMRGEARGALLLAWALGCGGGATEEPPGAGGTSGSGGSAGGNAGTSSGGSAGTSEPDAGPPEPRGDAGPPVVAGPVDKLDLLFMIDNSISMNDKQSVLKIAVPDLVSRLTNPLCVDESGNAFPAPAPGEVCPAGQVREFEALLDIHIGVVTSSLGDAGANVACAQEGFDGFVADRIDMAHLVPSLPRGPSATIPTGFLTWSAGTDAAAFNQGITQMVDAVGESGCGFEAQLESWYRFLVDPYPYRSLTRVLCPGSTSPSLNCVQPEVTEDNRLVLDDVLLRQRAAFLRPDSMLAVVMLTDENDCSLQIGSQNWVVAAINDTRPMFRGSSACAENPNDKCCYSCPLGAPAGCNSDPICNADESAGVLINRLPAAEDGQNLRCFEQKRRFGVDFLYPTQRYINALREPELCWNAPDLSTAGCAAADRVANPLYTGGRPRERVLFAGIIGVPWQAIDTNFNERGRPLQPGQLRFQSSADLADGNTWAAILGDPGLRWQAQTADAPEVIGTAPVPPTLPQMIESSGPRANIEDGNDMNGREYNTQLAGAGPPDDLEYACIFPLPVPRDCALADPITEACDCFPEDFDTPLCEQTPGISAPGTIQYWAKAYPGSRHLEVLKGVGESAVVASICARNVADPEASDFGYRPAMAAIIERMRAELP